MAGTEKLSAFKIHHEKVRKKGVPSAIEGSKLTPVAIKTGWEQPKDFKTVEDVRSLLTEVRAQNASEILVMPGEPISIMIDGLLKAITYRCLKLNEANFILETVTHSKVAVAKLSGGESLNGTTELFERDEDGIDVKNIRGLKKFNRYRHNAAPCLTPLGSNFQITMRYIPDEPPIYSSIGITEEEINQFVTPEGMVIIAGRTGSGKTTTLASTIRYILEGDTLIKGHVITLEDPIEFRYDSILSPHSIISQSQIGVHFPSFAAAARETVRRYPALILLGELRDSETIMAAVEAAQTGHPVYTTTHATDVPSIVPRMVSRFPEGRKTEAAYDIVESTRIFMAQKLVKKPNGKRFAVREKLVLTKELRKELLDIITEKGEISMIREIRRIVDNQLHGATNFKSQADELWSKGMICRHSYIELTS